MAPRILVLDIAERSATTDVGCVEWLGATSRGYGHVRRGGRDLMVHRVMCEWGNGTAPPSKPWALHRCHNALCVRPDHLYWGDARDNARDTVAAGHATGGRAGATHCINGHAFTDENTYREPRGRACKACRREAVRRYRARVA